MLALAVESAQAPPDVWVVDGATRSAVQVTHLNPEIESIPMGSRRIINWTSRDGTPTHGLLLLPSGYTQGQRYPLITYVGGDPYHLRDRYLANSPWFFLDHVTAPILIITR